MHPNDNPSCGEYALLDDPNLMLYNRVQPWRLALVYSGIPNVTQSLATGVYGEGESR